MLNFSHFDALSVDLKGSNLIEASAGTGKTYSISLLVVRLILEKQLPVNSLLMVTFTKAAVAELESRIRLFVRMAYRSARGLSISEKSIAAIVARAIESTSRQQVTQLLKEAVLLLDETSVQTIHGFCQTTLEEFALEADLRYDPEIATDASEIVEHLVDDFWRLNVTTLPAEALKLLMEVGSLSKADLSGAVKNALEGKFLYGFEPDGHYSLGASCISEVENTLLSGSPEQVDQLIRELPRRLIFGAVRELLPAVAAFKQERHLLTYDDMIEKLHAALVKNKSEQLIGQLQKKFSAVFIDEFQDTDRLQYEIFSTAFNHPASVIFYIGDPKQSIYSWRKADINTYLKATHQVDRLYSMNHNFRSSESMIQAMNQFFLPTAGFDTFAFGRAAEGIHYTPVESPMPNGKGMLKQGQEEDQPITIFEVSKKTEVIDPLVAQVALLLSKEHYSIEKNGASRSLTPNDIGILVRTNTDAQNIKQALAQAGIPAVTIGEAKVFDSAEAEYVLYLLEAFESLSQGAINKALLSPFTGLALDDILKLNIEKAAELFRKYRDLWRQFGVFQAVKAFMADWNVQGLLLSRHTEMGERTIANLYHLTELLHKAENTKKRSSIELIGWLRSAIKGAQPADDEFELRVESDEDAVTIVTIHKSKGLQYNVVIAPYLDMITYNKHEVVSWRDPQAGQYMVGNKRELGPTEKTLWQDQLVQENRRLLYVAITRAVYKCFIFKVNVQKGAYSTKKSALAAFVDPLPNNPEAPISFEPCPALMPGYFYASSSNRKPTYAEAAHFKLADLNWRKMSYSSLSVFHEASPKIHTGDYANDYDQFVFSDLIKGAKTGDMLHFIFEHINFVDATRWNAVVDEALTLFMPRCKEAYSVLLRRLISEVLTCQINFNGDRFQLCSIDDSRRINELEFDFSVPPVRVEKIKSYSNPEHAFDIGRHGELEGMMNGKIDLFFEHQGKYYILDWKSNYLGDTHACYASEKLNQAMNENNYHLQHLIYTAAVDRYLKLRIPAYRFEQHFGGVIYLFLRGVRAGSDNGVFVFKPTNSFYPDMFWQ